MINWDLVLMGINEYDWRYHNKLELLFLFEYLNQFLKSTALKCKFHHHLFAPCFLKCASSIDTMKGLCQIKYRLFLLSGDTVGKIISCKNVKLKSDCEMF